MGVTEHVQQGHRETEPERQQEAPLTGAPSCNDEERTSKKRR